MAPETTAIATVGPVTLSNLPPSHMVEGHCTDCLHTFAGFGWEAGRTMARRHIVLAHPEIDLDGTDPGEAVT